jgi:hypothetical protein
MYLKYLLLLGCLTLNHVNASEYLVGDTCSIGDFRFKVVDVESQFIEIKSDKYSMFIGKNKLSSICEETQLNAIKNRRILWVGRR